MRKSSLRLVLILGMLCIAGALITQVFWLRKALQVKQSNFDQSVLLSLRRVAERIDFSSANTIVTLDVVRKISPRNFQLNINDRIDCNTLEFYLRTELAYPGLNIDFSYAVFDLETGEKKFEKAVELASQDALYSITTNLPILEGSNYAIVSFPSRAEYIGVKMTIWIFSSLVLLIVVIFFGYTVIVILRQLRLMEVQKDFVSNMAHEFKTPISTISISAETLSNPDIIREPGRLANYAGIIKSEANRLRNQVDKLLQMAKLERDKIDLHLEQLDLHSLIREVIPNFSLKLNENTGTIHYQLQAAQHTLLADRIHLTNILYNLLDNSVKYTDQFADIRITTQNSDGMLIFSIKDNGIGIPEEFQSRVFEKFFRVPTGNLHNVKGFGLGLHYLQLVVRAHGWKIKLESAPGKGSNFIIFVPVTANGKQES